MNWLQSLFSGLGGNSQGTGIQATGALGNQAPTNQGFNFGGVMQGVGALGGLLMNYQAQQQAKKAMEQQLALNKANFANTAQTLNTQYADQMSGRGYVGMSNAAKGALGNELNNRKLNTTY